MNAAFAKKRWPEKNGVFIQVQEMQWVGAIWQQTCAQKWNSITPPSVTHFWHLTYLVDVLWGQPIKLVQVASTSELHDNQWNDLLSIEIIPRDFCGAPDI